MEKAAGLLATIIDIGMIDPEGSKKEKAFRVENSAFMFVTEGTASVMVNIQEHPIGRNDIVTIMQGAMVRISDYSEDFRAYHLNFPLGFSQDVDLWKNTMGSLTSIIQHPVLHITKEENIALINNYCSMLYDICSKQEITYKQEIIKNMLESVMFAISGFYRDTYPSSPAKESGNGESLTSRRYDIYKHFLGLVSKNYQTHREVSYYADILCITPKHLGYVVKSASGILASDTIARAVVMDAKSKLKSSGLSVSEISDSLNFPNPSFFCKYFKKHTGMTPRQFRKSDLPASDHVLTPVKEEADNN